MAGENLEIVQRGFDAFNEGGVDGILPFIHGDFESTTPPELASEPDTYRGHDGVRRYFDSFYEAMDDVKWDANSFEEEQGRVLVDFTLRARGKSTGLEVAQRAAMVWTLRDGKATRLELYPSLDEARQAVSSR